MSNGQQQYDIVTRQRLKNNALSVLSGKVGGAINSEFESNRDQHNIMKEVSKYTRIGSSQRNESHGLSVTPAKAHHSRKTTDIYATHEQINPELYLVPSRWHKSGWKYVE